MLKSVALMVADYARPYNGLGNAYYNSGDFDEAINMYKKSV